MNNSIRYLLGNAMVIAFLCAVSLAVADEPGQNNLYSGDFLKRSTLTGDWGGLRNDLARKGVTFDVSVTQTYQGVVDGGKGSSWEYGGRGDLTLKWIREDGTLARRFADCRTRRELGQGGKSLYRGAHDGEHQPGFPGGWGDPSGSSRSELHPGPVEARQLFAGKLDTIVTGDLNAFAHGKGEDQFMNLAFNINPVLIMTVPYSTLGAGVIIKPARTRGRSREPCRRELFRGGQYQRLFGHELERADLKR